ncbi:hypothetical protein [Arthrobacter sp. AZCC_0090]|uniref:hypothetical protein n=1 Tax=Arthrobacter sp. AZCC_0090 TaxID=2735881 RepID=UPI001610764C|nr:hypothetical protein [Arthrobacter sp. AZCC_0090]MBB6405756.1 hypothetical protein [Arthrobacter sp. AZCC_0090]
MVPSVTAASRPPSKPIRLRFRAIVAIAATALSMSASAVTALPAHAVTTGNGSLVYSPAARAGASSMDFSIPESAETAIPA